MPDRGSVPGDGFILCSDCENNRTPFRQVHLARNGKLVNDLDAPVCCFAIPDIPKKLQLGNAFFVMRCLNDYKKLKADRDTLLAFLNGFIYAHDAASSPQQFADAVEDWVFKARRAAQTAKL